MTYLYENLGKAMDDREGTVGNRPSTGSGGRTTVTPSRGVRPAYTPPRILGGRMPKPPTNPKPFPKPAPAPLRGKGIYGIAISNSKIAVPVTRGPIQMPTPAAVLTAPIVTPLPATTQAPASGGYPSSGGGGGGSFSPSVGFDTEPAAEFPEDPPAPNTEASTKPSGGMSTTTLVLIGLGLYLLTRSRS